jgi:4-hydroxysphinganine ceramide fatty acyl 2-hydroxylase
MLIPVQLVCAVGAGAIFGYVCYDMCHYFLHHGKPPIEYLRELKTYHLNHHYKNWELGFGITTKFWDRVFGTELFNNPAGMALKTE